MLKQTEIEEIFKSTKALLEGHFLLTSGLHSPNYFQCAKVLQYPQHMTNLCTDIAKKIERMPVDVVIGPAIGGIVVAQEVGRILNKRTIFAERENNEMTLRRGFEIARGESVVIVEDVLTTGKSINEVARLIEKSGGALTAVAVIVDRSGGAVHFSAPTEALITLKVTTYEPGQCPLCQQGIKLVKPGSRMVFDRK